MALAKEISICYWSFGLKYSTKILRVCIFNLKHLFWRHPYHQNLKYLFYVIFILCFYLLWVNWSFMCTGEHKYKYNLLLIFFKKIKLYEKTIINVFRYLSWMNISFRINGYVNFFSQIRYQFVLLDFWI